MSVEKIRGYNVRLRQLINQQDFTNAEIKKLIKCQKVMIFSVPNLQHQPNEYLIEARTFAELNLFYCLVLRVIKEFEMAIEGVRFFYENDFNLPKSENEKEIIAIHLLFLLSTHRNEEFYTKLENLSTVEIHYDLVQYVLKMNEAIEEGNYRKVFQKRKQCPLQYFNPFLQKIEDTIRIQVAKSAEKAYRQLTISEALKIFQEPDEESLKNFIQEYTEKINEPMVSWRVQNNRVVFEKNSVQNVKFNSEELIKTTLMYSEELEKIA